MFKILTERVHQKFRTVPYPAKPPVLPPRFRGRPVLAEGTRDAVAAAVSACPTGAFSNDNGSPNLDMGLCLLCGACAKAAPQIVSFSRDQASGKIGKAISSINIPQAVSVVFTEGVP